MKTSEIRSQLEYIFLFELDIMLEDISDHATNNELGMDSVDKAIIIADMERTFDIEIHDVEFDALKEFKDYVALVERKLA